MISGRNKEGGAYGKNKESQFDCSFKHLAVINTKNIATEKTIIHPLNDDELTSDSDVDNKTVF